MSRFHQQKSAFSTRTLLVWMWSAKMNPRRPFYRCSWREIIRAGVTSEEGKSSRLRPCRNDRRCGLISRCLPAISVSLAPSARLALLACLRLRALKIALGPVGCRVARFAPAKLELKVSGRGWKQQALKMKRQGQLGPLKIVLFFFFFKYWVLLLDNSVTHTVEREKWKKGKRVKTE